MSVSDGTELNNELICLPDEWADWTVTERIGTGSFGTVYLAERDGEECAVKMILIPSDESERAALLVESKDEQTAQLYLKDLVENYSTEIHTMYSLQENPHIVKIEEHLVQETAPFGFRIYIRMELLTPMRDYFAGRFPTEEQAVQVGLDICDALIACDVHRIIHRDIKPDNIFVSESGDFKLGDFGTARQLDLTFGTYSAKGTYSYMAPEVYKQERYNKQVDLYSLGMVLYRLLNRNREPFVDPQKQLVYYQDREEAIRRRMDGEPIPDPLDASSKMSSVIRKACAFRAANRYPDAAAMRAELLKVLDPAAEIEEYVEPKLEEKGQDSLSTETGTVLPEGINSASNHRRTRKRRNMLLAGTLLLIFFLMAGVIMYFFLREKRFAESSPDGEKTVQTEKEDSIPVGTYDEAAGLIPIRESGQEFSEEMDEALEAVEEIAADLSVYALEDKASFESYFINADEDDINDYYTAFRDFNEYGNWMTIPVSEYEGLYLINMIGYKNVEQYESDDTDMVFQTGQKMYLSKEDGVWMINLDQNQIEAMEKMLTEQGYYPAGFAESRERSIHNRVWANPNNYMHLDETKVYIDYSSGQVMFIWQEETGDVLLSLLLVNGTYQEQTYQNIRIKVNDKSLGSILEGTLPESISVPARRNRIITYRFDKDDVLTGMDGWEDVTSAIKWDSA